MAMIGGRNAIEGEMSWYLIGVMKNLVGMFIYVTGGGKVLGEFQYTDDAI